MIKFFRKIRLDALSRKRFPKYFTYAIGEIILVVIGILIALQINNWNEDRKNDSFEKEILTQIRTNLIEDQTALNEIIKNSEKAISSIDKILAEDVSVTVNDSIKYWLGDILRFDRFNALSNAYEVLKSQGIDKVSNKELQLLLGQYYDNRAIRATNSVRDQEKMFVNDWVPILKTNIIDLKFGALVDLKDYSSLKTGGEIKNMLILNRDNLNGHIRSNQTVDLIDKILSIINTELND